MEVFVYVLESIENDYRYTGITKNLQKRLKSHNRGNNGSTAPYSPFEIIYSETCGNYKEARDREKYLKSGRGREFIDNEVQ
jgi:putative endonuclease